MSRAGNRDALLAAALACIKDKGYARTTARDLVKASGTNLGAIGYHFGSKEKLLNEAVYRGFCEWLEKIAEAAPPVPSGDLWQVLERAIEGTLDGLDAQRPLCVAFVEALAQAERSEELREQVAAGYERYRHAVVGYLQAPRGGGAGLPDSEAAALATLIVALSDGLLIQWLIDPERLPSATDLTKSLRVALRAAESS